MAPPALRGRRLAPLAAAGALALVGAVGAGPALGDTGSVAWTSDRDGLTEIYVAPVGGGAPLNISQAPLVNDFGASLSADGRVVAWTSIRDGNQEIYVAPADGTGVPVNVSKDTADDNGPSLSADGRVVAWGSHRDGDWEIYVAPADGTGAPVNVSKDAAQDLGASLSAGGRMVAWGSDRDGDGEIYVAPADGGGTPVNVSQSPLTDDSRTSLSADGRTVAWEGYRDGQFLMEVYVAPASGGGTPVNVSKSSPSTYDADPSLSADGRVVAWTSDRDGNEEIYAAPADGTGAPVNVSKGSADDLQPSLSPDGGTVAWKGYRDGNGEIYVAPADGTGAPVNISKHSADDLQPSLSEVVRTPAPPPPPPPPRAPEASPAATWSLTGARSLVRYALTRATGAIEITGTAARPANVRVLLRRKAAIRRAGGLRSTAVPQSVQRFTFRIRAAGPFSRRLQVGPGTFPGRYTLSMAESGPADGPALPPLTRALTVRPPRQGVVQRALIGRRSGGPAVARFAQTGRMVAGFRFWSLPAQGLQVRVAWYRDGRLLESGAALISGPRAGGALLAPAGASLAAGRYRAELRVAGTVVAEATSRVG
jgi:Tol biopolymer transport system component